MVEVIEIGEMVLCDMCNEDFSDSRKHGGFIFSSKGVCPNCAEEFMAGVKLYGEQRYIKAVCPDEMSFRDFILNYRNGDNTIKIFSGDECDEMFGENNEVHE